MKRKLNEIVISWLGTDITPAEFVGTKRLGYITQSSSIKGIEDSELVSKLLKVEFEKHILNHFACISLSLR